MSNEYVESCDFQERIWLDNEGNACAVLSKGAGWGPRLLIYDGYKTEVTLRGLEVKRLKHLLRSVEEEQS